MAKKQRVRLNPRMGALVVLRRPKKFLGWADEPPHHGLLDVPTGTRRTRSLETFFPRSLRSGFGMSINPLDHRIIFSVSIRGIARPRVGPLMLIAGPNWWNLWGASVGAPSVANKKRRPRKKPLHTKGPESIVVSPRLGRRPTAGLEKRSSKKPSA